MSELDLASLPQIQDINKLSKFFSSSTLLGAYLADKDKEQEQPTKHMNFEEKVQHIKHDLGSFLDFSNTSKVDNSIYIKDQSGSVSYDELRLVLAKVCNYERLFKDTLMPPSPTLSQLGNAFMGMQMMMPPVM